jgi:light-harvesting complex I chlorophyll a/b binding protein 1
MFRFLVLFATIATVAAFTSTGRLATRSSPLKMSVFPENPTELPGDIAPTGFFDPLGLSNGKDANTIKMWREAELKHGRVCMLASVGVLTQELLKNPLGIDGPGIRHFDLVDQQFPEFGELFILLCAFIEGWTIQNKWESRSETRDLKRAARLRDDVDAGDYGWDPLEWYPEDPEEQAIIKTKELQNGRLAMLGFAGIVAQELTDGKEILCHFQKVCN